MSSPDASASGTERFVRRALIALLIVALALLAWKVVEVFLLVFGGLLLAILLGHLAAPVNRVTGLSHRWSLAIVLLGLLLLGGLGAWLLGSQLAGQFADLSNRLPSAWQTLKDSLRNTGWNLGLIGGSGSGPAGGVLSNLANVLTTVVWALADLILVLFIGIYFAATPSLYRRGALHLVPPDHRDRAADVIEASGETLWKWFLGQLASMVIVGILTTLGLWLLGTPLALALGIIAGLAEFIPIVGPILAAIPAILLGFTQSPTTALYVALFYVVLQQVESNLILPIVQKEAVSLPPVVTLTAVVIAGLVFGPLGILFATPLAVVVLVIVKMLYLRDTLGDRDL
jgi:predicted PurR-regulated permease PerM